MRTFVANLQSISPLGFNKAIMAEKNAQELDKDFEERTWRQRGHYDQEEKLFIPPMAFKKSLEASCPFLNVKIKGRRQATYTKHFKAGILVPEGLTVPITQSEVKGTWIHVPSNGKAGGGSRVWKCFPTIQEWHGEVSYIIVDDIIDLEVFKQHLEAAGRLIGLLFWRPANGGLWGRYKTVSVEEKKE